MATKSTTKKRKASARNVKASVALVVNDVVVDDSDKTFTVPAGQEWELMSVFAQLISTATAGNRIMQLLITDASDNILAIVRTAITQAASLTRRYQYFATPRDTAFINDTANLPLPPMLLPAGYKVRVFDEAAIAAAADDLSVRITAQVFKY